MLRVLIFLFFASSTFSLHFHEPFDESWGTRWNIINNQKYQGHWSVEKPQDQENLPGSEALTVLDVAKHHAIITSLRPPLNHTDGDFVLQYEVKFLNGLECGGAYLKLFAGEQFGPSSFSSETPYTIMFGPDKCGFDSKIHFIFQHKNPLTHEFQEKHLISPPIVPSDKLSHLYSLVIHDNNKFEMFVDMELVKEGSLLEDFIPSVNPLKEIDDPNDFKPKDWIDEPMMPDPDTEMPDNWDESQPKEITDLEAIKPKDWLEEEPLFVSDEKAQKPLDWNDEDDGQWFPPQIPNPRCVDHNCGKWEPPTKKNQHHMGKWRAPLIDNPSYKGDWNPRKIPNPNYYQDLHPLDLKNMIAVGFELWTVTERISFDNIIMTDDKEKAFKFASTTWQHKFEQDRITYKDFEDEEDFQELDSFRRVWEMAKVVANMSQPIIIGITIFAGFLPLLVFYLCLRGKGEEEEMELTSEEIKKRE